MCVCAYVYLCILVREIHAQLFRHVLRPEVIIRMSFSVTSSPYFVWVLLCVCVSVSHTLYGCSCLKFYMYFSVQWELSHWWRRIPVLACRYHHHHLPCKSSNSCDPPPFISVWMKLVEKPFLPSGWFFFLQEYCPGCFHSGNVLVHHLVKAINLYEMYASLQSYH